MRKIKQFFSNFNQITPIRAEWNDINGLIFTVADIEWCGEKSDFHSALFGLYISESFIIVDLLYFTIFIKSYLS